MDEHEAGVRRNEATSRAINEQLRSLNEDFSDLTHAFQLVCECGSLGCIAKIQMKRERYEAVRADVALFVIVPGHEVAGLESIVEQGAGYDVVRKRPAAQD